MRVVSSWGRTRRVLHDIVPVPDRSSLAEVVRGTPQPALAFGNGRSYGDVCLNSGHSLWAMRGLDRFIDFDASTGLLACEAGVLLKEVVELALPHGWFLPVTPGTQLATVGGAIANDVHGKNHHRHGTFGENVEQLRLVRTDGMDIECARDVRPEWFAATVGGMGLTGMIASAILRLRRVPGPWIDSQSHAFASLAEFFELSASLSRSAEYNVAWIDCATDANGATRGIFFSGDHAEDGTPASPRADRRLPIDLPFSLVNGWSVKAFNSAYFARHSRASGPTREDYRAFFYPLDNLLEWNRLYGKAGFYQYQCVVPREVESDATQALLRAIARSRQGSFLAVLKTFDDRAPVGLLSFPCAGTTLALDFPNRPGVVDLFRALDAIVAEAGGRVYAAKDASAPRQMFERSFPKLGEFVAYRDPGIASDMSRRLFGH